MISENINTIHQELNLLRTSHHRNINRLDFIKKLTLLTGAIVTSCTPVRVLLKSYPDKYDDNKKLKRKILDAFVLTVIPGANPSDPDLCRIYVDDYYPFHKFCGFFVSDLCSKSRDLFGTENFHDLSPRQRTQVIQAGLDDDATTAKLYNGAIYMAQVSYYSSIYSDEKVVELIDFDGNYGFMDAEMSHKNCKSFLANEITVTGNYSRCITEDKMKRIKTEILIIGSGFGAAAPALRFSEKGFKVLMLEKGKDIIPEKDFRMTQDPKYLLKYLKGVGSDNIEFTYAEALGGGSGFYEMVSLRAPSKAFSQKDKHGRKYWPSGINRSNMDQYFDIAEKILNVEQITKEEIPKSGVVFSNLMKNLGYSCDRARYAIKGCVGSGYCISGCIFSAKQSLLINYLPMAKKAGMQILTESEALNIRTLIPNVNSTKYYSNINGIPYRYSVKCKQRENDEIFEVLAKIVVLGAGTIGTAKLLLNSRNNLHFLSRHVGKNIAFNGSVKAVGLLPEGMIEGDMFSGRSHPGTISYQFFESLGITISSAKPLPLHTLSAARLVLEDEKRTPAYWGKAHVELMKNYRRRIIVLYALGLTPPGAEISISNSGNISPKLDLDSTSRNYYQTTSNLLKSIFKRNGCKLVNVTTVDQEGQQKDGISFSTTHMIGSCRMADNKENGVTDEFGEVFDYPGIFVTDGAVIPTSLAVNSSLTILANAERIAHHLDERFSVNKASDRNNLQIISSTDN